MSIAAKLVAIWNQAGTTWNPLDKAADIALSNGNLTARNGSAGGAHANVRSATARNSGKRYFEIVNAGAVANQLNLGICSASFALTGAFAVPGAQVASAGYWLSFGELDIGGVNVASPATNTANGGVSCFAIDFVNGNMWVRKQGADWNGDPTADPATNTGGFNFASTLPGPAYIVADVPYNDGSGALINPGSSPFAGAIPAGFTAWD